MTNPEQLGGSPPDPSTPAPDEHIGDLYRADLDEHGRVSNMEQLKPRPAVWIGSWLDYNNGVLHGAWVHADQDDDGIWHDVQKVLASSPTARATGDAAEDWGIFDHDNFGPLRIGEQETIAWVGAVGRGIAEHGPAFAAYADVIEDLEALSGFSDDYIGRFESVEAFAAGFAEDAGYNALLDTALPDCIRGYVQIDTDAIGRDMVAAGDLRVVAAEDGGVWLFHSG